VSADYDLAALKEDFDYVILATGAWKEGHGPLPVDGNTMLDALSFLTASRESSMRLNIGKRIAVIGGGDVAMDCARAAARNAGVEEVVVVYRRTKDFMPAQAEEIKQAEEDGVNIRTLLSPVAYENGRLICERMSLQGYDASGRRGVVSTGERETMEFDTVISAVGSRVDTSQFLNNGITLGLNGFAALSESNETSVPGVYIAGDCKEGPRTVVKAMADAKRIATDILERTGIKSDFKVYDIEHCRSSLIEKKGLIEAKAASIEDAPHDAARCLSCGKVCEICADVCPNRANVVVGMPNVAGGKYQIVHMDGMCNECGNCGVFCPAQGNPYKDKLTVFTTEEDFADSANRGFLPEGRKRFKVRLEDSSVVDYTLGSGAIPAAFERMISAIVTNYPYLIPADSKG
jgi:putative selenate reductase